MKKMFLFLTLLLSVAIGGCAAPMRYSAEEIKDFPPAVQERIRNSEVGVGMTTQQVRYSWGGPSQVNQLPPGEDGAQKLEWVYERMGVFKTRLIFSNDKLIHIVSNEPGIIKGQ